MANKIMPAYEELTAWYTAQVEASVQKEISDGQIDQTGDVAKRQQVCKLINDALRKKPA